MSQTLTPPLAGCKVLTHSACCFHPTCYSRRPEKCDWLNYYTGLELIFVGAFFSNSNSGHSCPKPGSIPNGTWSCQMQELLIPDATFLDSDANTYPGERGIFKHLVGAHHLLEYQTCRKMRRLIFRRGLLVFHQSRFWTTGFFFHPVFTSFDGP